MEVHFADAVIGVFEDVLNIMPFKNYLFRKIPRNKLFVNLRIIDRFDALSFYVYPLLKQIRPASNYISPFKVQGQGAVVSKKKGPGAFNMKDYQLPLEPL